MDKNIKIVELFAGVGGFRLAAKKANLNCKFIWVNQWEPNKKIQHAFDCYERNFGKSKFHSNEDICIAKNNIPKEIDILVGGFPCQDYSVATTKAKGIQGIKGVLWWEINEIITKNKPRVIFLENVDRLLKSPSNIRGRDFAIMLKCFNDNGYNVEWMVNNGSDYGYPQRRKRVYIVAYKVKNKNIFKNAFKYTLTKEYKSFDISKFSNLLDVSHNYCFGKLGNIGSMFNGIINSYDYVPVYNGKYKYLKDILLNKYDNDLILTNLQLEKMKYYKSHKKIERLKENSKPYFYTEGKMNLYDDINCASRTMLTSEGTPNRSTHIIKQKEHARFLDPIECEKLNGFTKNWTKGMPRRMRYYCMGNALIVGVVSEIFKSIRKELF